MQILVLCSSNGAAITALTQEATRLTSDGAEIACRFHLFSSLVFGEPDFVGRPAYSMVHFTIGVTITLRYVIFS
jgi:hypothetical protein